MHVCMYVCVCVHLCLCCLFVCVCAVGVLGCPYNAICLTSGPVYVPHSPLPHRNLRLLNLHFSLTLALHASPSPIGPPSSGHCHSHSCMQDGKTALLYQLERENGAGTYIAELLLERKADPNAADKVFPGGRVRLGHAATLVVLSMSITHISS